MLSSNLNKIRASMKLVLSETFPDPSGSSDDHSFSWLLNNTKKILVKLEAEPKSVEDK